MKQIAWEKDTWKWSYEFYENGYNWKGIIQWDSMFKFLAKVSFDDFEYKINRSGFWRNKIRISNFNNSNYNLKFSLLTRKAKLILPNGNKYILTFRYKSFKLNGSWVHNKKEIINYYQTSSYKNEGTITSDTDDKILDALLIPLGMYIRRSFYNK